MANTILHDGKTFEIIPDGSTDWLYSTYFSGGMRIKSIQFIATAANDRLIIREYDIDGATLFDSGAMTGAGVAIEYLDGKRCKPCIDASDCTFGTAADCKIIIDYQ